jgi:hypothetical protein
MHITFLGDQGCTITTYSQNKSATKSTRQKLITGSAQTKEAKEDTAATEFCRTKFASIKVKPKLFNFKSFTHKAKCPSCR